MNTYAWMQELKFDSMGLIPAIVQDALTGEVLMMAYMNAESLRLSIEENYTCFYSRSRQALWRKGETSGNMQKVVSITADCDLDTLLVKVQAMGPACHTGENSCFFNGLHQGEKAGGFSSDQLYDLIKERKKTLPKGSYTTYLFEKGKEKILKKVGEECSEVIIAAMKNSAEETVYEAADLYYHMLVLLCELGIDPQAVRHELEKRHIIDHKVKQETLR